MRLLEKHEVSRIKSLERKKEVEEGLKLAKTVDKLRETKSEEEAKLRKFREESLKLIKQEIDSKIIERDNLQTEVKRLQDERILAEAPIDLVTEWKSVKKDRKDIEAIKTDLFNRETQVIQRESGVEATKKDLFAKEENLKELANMTNRYNLEAESAYDIAEKTRLKAENDARTAEQRMRREDDRLRAISTDLSIRERDLKNDRDALEQELLDLEREKLHIASQQETLRQAWNSIKKLT